MVIDEIPFDAMAFDETTFHDKASYEVAFKKQLALNKSKWKRKLLLEKWHFTKCLLTKCQLTKFQLTKFQLTKFQLTKFQLIKFHVN